MSAEEKIKLHIGIKKAMEGGKRPNGFSWVSAFAILEEVVSEMIGNELFDSESKINDKNTNLRTKNN